jgi:uncharacterized protein with GYD domain
VPTFITILQFTEQGIRDVAHTAQRAMAFEAAAQQAGAKVLHLYWVLGEYDGLIVFEAQDDEAAATLMMRLGALGNVRTKTSRAFTAHEITKILAAM